MKFLGKAESPHLDTFKDIWGRRRQRAEYSEHIRFRYLQGYMGTLLAIASRCLLQ